MAQNEYNELLDRASGIFSKSTQSEARLKIPEPDIIREGKSTIVRNFEDIADMINRDPKHISKFLMKEFGIGVTISGRRLIINRKVTFEQISSKIAQYLDSYVKCYECGSPDTEFLKVGRTNLLSCKACGAQHPIRLARESKFEETQLEEGKQYVVEITEKGSSGEGRAMFRGYSLFVPGAKKGETVKVLIKRIKRGMAIAEIVDKE